MVGAGGGRAASFVGRRGGLIVAREVRAPAGGAAVDLRQAAAGARPFLAAPLLPARRPLLLAGVLAEIQFGVFPASTRTHRALDWATGARPLNGTRGRSIAKAARMRGVRPVRRAQRFSVLATLDGHVSVINWRGVSFLKLIDFLPVHFIAI